MKEQQTAVYLNHAELVKIHWALNNLHLAHNTGEVEPLRGENVQEALDSIKAIIDKIREAKKEVLAKEADEWLKLNTERECREYAAKFEKAA